MVADATTSNVITPLETPMPSPSLNLGPKNTNVNGQLSSNSVDYQVVSSTSQVKDPGSVTQVMSGIYGSPTAANTALNEGSDAADNHGAAVSPNAQTSAVPAGYGHSDMATRVVSPDETSQRHNVPTPIQPSTLQHQDGESSGITSPLGDPQTPLHLTSIQDTFTQQNPSAQNVKSPSVTTWQESIPPRPSSVYFPVAGDPEPIAQGSTSWYDKTLATATGVDEVAQSSVFGSGKSLALPLPAATAQVTTISGYAMQTGTDGVSIEGTIVTIGAAPFRVSGISVSVDSSSQVYLDGTPHQLPTPVPPVTLANSAVVLPVQNGVSIYGTKLAPGAPEVTASGTVISLDDSGNLFLADGAISDSQSHSFDLSNADSVGSTLAISSQTMAAFSTKSDVAETLSPGGPAVTINNIAVAIDQASQLVVGSETLTVQGPRGGLGPLIMGGLQSGGPHAANSTSKVEATLPTTFAAIPSLGPSSISRAGNVKEVLMWKLVATLIGANALCLHV